MSKAPLTALPIRGATMDEKTTILYTILQDESSDNEQKAI